MTEFSQINNYIPNINRDSEIDAFKRLFDILKQHGVKCWVDFGTLLGFYRDKNVISHDIDMDISCLNEKENKYSNSWEILVYLQDEFYIKHYIENSYLAVVPKNYKFNLYQIDIHIHHLHSKHIICPTFPNLKSRYFFIDEIEYINLFNYNFPVPRHLDEYLSIKYGFDWNIKKENASASINTKDNLYTCYITMVGDLFHQGHYNILKKCKDMFDKVIVGVHSDEQILSYKQIDLIDTYEQRVKNIRDTQLCDVIIEKATPFVTDEIMKELNADFLVAGREDPERLKKVYLMDPKKIHLVERTPNISSTDLRVNY